MTLELWKDESGRLVEITCDYNNKIYFYRNHPWNDKERPRMWEGLISPSTIKRKGWTYIKHLLEDKK